MLDCFGSKIESSEQNFFSILLVQAFRVIIGLSVLNIDWAWNFKNDLEPVRFLVCLCSDYYFCVCGRVLVLIAPSCFCVITSYLLKQCDGVKV